MSIVISNKTKSFFTDFVIKRINSPEQRLIQGAFALGLQPMFDYNNHSADDETRAISVARTIGKIVAGTTVGVLVRYGAIAIAKKFSNYGFQKIVDNYVLKVGPKTKKDFLMPNIEYPKPKWTPTEFKQIHDNFVKTMGTLLASFAMVFTNFLCDAPLTKLITTKLTPKMMDKIQRAKISEVNNDSVQ